jgi:Protein of unknown function (DUF3828)
MKFLASCALALLFAVPALPTPQTAQDIEIEKSCRDFVQKFYDWYVPQALDLKVSNATDVALKTYAYVFTPELVKLLQEDSDAQAKHPGEIVGLDFDPFLSSRDPSEQFVARSIIRKGSSYLVEVNGISSSGRKEKVIAEVVRKKDRWLFQNFHYPNFEKDNSKDPDLITILKRLRETRQHAK